MPRTIVTAPGSLGDVNPLLAIACILRDAGHDVTFFAAERYLPLVQRAGLRGLPLVSETQFHRWAADPRLWHPRYGARVILRDAVADYLRPHLEWLQQNCRPAETLLISHVLDFSGRIFRDLHPESRLVSILPAPVLLRSSHAPPRLSGYFWEGWYPKPWMPLAYRCIDFYVDRLGVSPINRLRRENGLDKVKRFMNCWWRSPDLTVGLFPRWFSIPTEDLPSKVRLVGFPFADSAAYVDATVDRQLESTRRQISDRRPIVFAPGTAHHHAAKFLRCASEASARVGKPAILISSDDSQFPPLAPHTIHAKYLPFTQLLPQAEAIVHHGGIGTTSQALRAGVPQLVAPMAFDQFDNAERVAELGCGHWLPMKNVTTDRLAAALEQLRDKAPGVARVQAAIAREPDFAQQIVKLLAAPSAFRT